MSFWKTLLAGFKQVDRANDFRVVVTDKDWEPEWSDLISTQTVGINFNLVDKIVVLRVNQLNDGTIQQILFNVLNKDTQNIDQIEVKPIRGNAQRYLFVNGTLIDHEVELDHSDQTPVIHVLKFQFKEVNFDMVMTRRVKVEYK